MSALRMKGRRRCGSLRPQRTVTPPTKRPATNAHGWYHHGSPAAARPATTAVPMARRGRRDHVRAAAMRMAHGMTAKAMIRTMEKDHHTDAGAYTVISDAVSATHRLMRMARSQAYIPSAHAAKGSHQLRAQPWLRGSGTSGRLNGEYSAAPTLREGSSGCQEPA